MTIRLKPTVLLILLASISFLQSIKCEYRASKYVVKTNVYINQSLAQPYFVSKLKRSSRLSCVKECSADKNCFSSIYYEDSTSDANCYTYNDSLSSTYQNVSGNARLYIKMCKSFIYDFYTFSIFVVYVFGINMYL